MGQKYSAPQPGCKFRVIGAGLPRTGTASFSKALEILLGGPVYHGGTQVTLGPEAEILSWIKLLNQWPPTNDAQKQENIDIIQRRTDGFVAVTDAPASGLISELIELHPNAVVICTVRDPEKWVESMGAIADTSTKWFLRFVLFPLPSLRHFVDYINGLRCQWFALYGETEPVTMKTWDQHIAWLKEVVPADRLVFFEVKDGWEPLCRALDLPIPNVPFPRINDSKAMEVFAKKHVLRGLTRWAVILGSVIGSGIMAWWSLG